MECVCHVEMPDAMLDNSRFVSGRPWSEFSGAALGSSTVNGGTLATEGVRNALAQLLALYGMHVQGLETGITATTATNHPNPAPAVSGSETVHDPPTILTFAPFLVIMINLQTLDLKILNPFPSFPSSSKNNFTSPYPLVDV